MRAATFISPSFTSWRPPSKHRTGQIAIIDETDTPQLVLYTDAAQDSCRTRIGAKLTIPGDKTRITVYDVPDHIV